MRRAVGWAGKHAAGLTSNAGATGIGDLERTILLLAAAGRSPRAFARQDLVAALTRRVGRDGAVLGQVNLTAFAILALRAGRTTADAPELRRAGAWLARQQNDDGGFGFLTKGLASDIDDTAAALQALAALGGRRDALRRGAAYMRGLQNADGGMPQQRGGSSNAQSTAWAVQGLVAARRAAGRRAPRRLADPARVPEIARRSERRGALLAHQHADARVGHRIRRPGALTALAAGQGKVGDLPRFIPVGFPRL